MERYRKRNTSEREKVSAIMQIKEEKQLRGLTALFLLRKQAWGDIFAYFLPLISPETGQTGAFYGIVWDLYPHQAPQALLHVASVCTDSSCPVLGCCSSSWHTRAQHHDMAGEGLGRLWGGSQGAPWHHSTQQSFGVRPTWCASVTCKWSGEESSWAAQQPLSPPWDLPVFTRDLLII